MFNRADRTERRRLYHLQAEERLREIAEEVVWENAWLQSVTTGKEILLFVAGPLVWVFYLDKNTEPCASITQAFKSEMARNGFLVVDSVSNPREEPTVQLRAMETPKHEKPKSYQQQQRELPKFWR